MAMNFNRLLDIARALKLHNQTGRVFHCAMVLKSGKPIAIGTNDYNKSCQICRTYKRWKHLYRKDYRSALHAEIAATAKIKHRAYNPAKLTLVSMRINNNGKAGNAMPCPNCSYVLGAMGYKNIFYTDTDGKFQRFP